MFWGPVTYGGSAVPWSQTASKPKDAIQFSPYGNPRVVHLYINQLDSIDLYRIVLLRFGVRSHKNARFHQSVHHLSLSSYVMNRVPQCLRAALPHLLCYFAYVSPCRALNYDLFMALGLNITPIVAPTIQSQFTTWPGHSYPRRPGSIHLPVFALPNTEAVNSPKKQHKVVTQAQSNQHRSKPQSITREAWLAHNKPLKCPKTANQMQQKGPLKTT